MPLFRRVQLNLDEAFRLLSAHTNTEVSMFRNEYLIALIKFFNNSRAAIIIEKFESKLVNLFKVPGIEKLWHKPVNYYIDEKLKVTLFYKET